MFLNRDQYGKLLLGKEIEALGIKMRCYTLNEIFDVIGFEKYQSALAILNIDKLELTTQLKRNFDDLSLLQLHMVIPGLNEMLVDLIQIFLKPKNIVWNAELFNVEITMPDDSKLILSDDNYRSFFKILSDIYSVPLYESEEDLDFGTEAARLNWRVYQHALREGRRRDALYKTQIDLFSIISSVVNIGKLYKYSEIGELTVFQLYDSFYRLDYYENYSYVNRIRTSGMFDLSNAKLPEINWADIIRDTSNAKVFET